MKMEAISFSLWILWDFFGTKFVTGAGGVGGAVSRGQGWKSDVILAVKSLTAMARRMMPKNLRRM